MFTFSVYRLSPRVTKSPHSMSKPANNLTSTKDVKTHVDGDVDCWQNHHVDSNNKTSKQHPQEWTDDRIIDGCNTIA